MSISEKDGHPLAITHSTGQTNLSLHSLKSTETNHSTLIELNNNDENKEKEKKEKKDKLPPVGIFKLYRHATGKDTFLVVLGILCAIICGVGMPLTNILFGDLINVFVNNQNTDDLKSSNPECFNEDQFLANCTSLIPTVNVFQDYYAKIQSFGIGVAVIGLATWILSYVFVTCLNAAAESQVYRIRCLFLKAILRQDVGWYDTNETGDFASKLAEDLNKLQDGMGEKVGMFIYFVTIFVSSIITAFIYGWELTLVIFSVMPVLIVTGVIMTKATTSLAEQELESYGKAGAIAEEALSAIRTVVAFGGQDKEAARYMDKLDYAKKAGIKRGAITSVSTGVFTLIVYGSCALSFWYGVKAIMDDQEECLADPA